jgi:hypothetical protein
MKQNMEVTNAELSPHMSTQSDTKDRIASSMQESWKPPNNMPSRYGEADVATLSFQALSLQQTSSQPQSQPSLVLDEEHRFKPIMRGRRCRSEGFDLRATISTSTSSTPSGDQERPSMSRKVSLEPKVTSPINYFGGAMDGSLDIPKAFNFPQELERFKRRRHPSTSSLISEEEEEQPSPKTHKRRRLANRNRGLTSTDFDQILSQIGVGGGL